MSDDKREWLREIFRNREEPPPADVVPHDPPTVDELRAHLLKLNEHEDTWSEVTIPGEVITDVDGLPIGMTEARTEVVHRSAVVSTRQLEQAGLTAEDVPNLTVIDPPTKGNDHE